MNRLITLLLFISSFAFGQGYDFQQLCLDCAEQNGFYCGDDPANWTQYAPDGCVQTDWIVDGWEDCVDASDEAEGAEPTSILDCSPPVIECDTIFEIEYIYETVIEYVDVVIYDTIVETEYIEIVIEQYIDCVTGLPCNTDMDEVIDKSKNTGLMYNLKGQHIRKPESIYIENGEVKYIIN